MHSWADKARGLCSYVCALWVAGVEVPHGARGERLLEILEGGTHKRQCFSAHEGVLGWLGGQGGRAANALTRAHSVLAGGKGPAPWWIMKSRNS